MANEKRLIDANALIDDAEMDGALYACLGGMDDVRFLVDSQPTVDAVEVVRCKDCKQHIETKAENVAYCQKFNRFMKVDDFCSYGERRNDV